MNTAIKFVEKTFFDISFGFFLHVSRLHKHRVKLKPIFIFIHWKSNIENVWKT